MRASAACHSRSPATPASQRIRFQDRCITQTVMRQQPTCTQNDASFFPYRHRRSLPPSSAFPLPFISFPAPLHRLFPLPFKGRAGVGMGSAKPHRHAPSARLTHAQARVSMHRPARRHSHARATHSHTDVSPSPSSVFSILYSGFLQPLHRLFPLPFKGRAGVGMGSAAQTRHTSSNAAHRFACPQAQAHAPARARACTCARSVLAHMPRSMQR